MITLVYSKQTGYVYQVSQVFRNMISCVGLKRLLDKDEVELLTVGMEVKINTGSYRGRITKITKITKSIIKTDLDSSYYPSEIDVVVVKKKVDFHSKLESLWA